MPRRWRRPCSDPLSSGAGGPGSEAQQKAPTPPPSSKATLVSLSLVPGDQRGPLFHPTVCRGSAAAGPRAQDSVSRATACQTEVDGAQVSQAEALRVCDTVKVTAALRTRQSGLEARGRGRAPGEDREVGVANKLQQRVTNPREEMKGGDLSKETSHTELRLGSSQSQALCTGRPVARRREAGLWPGLRPSGQREQRARCPLPRGPRSGRPEPAGAGSRAASPGGGGRGACAWPWRPQTEHTAKVLETQSFLRSTSV